ncbi:hypothetical protein EAF04_004359 [Stromatinia cepivora]|nr:hypothetical protein EAF04_004359 [Stromatinia cepivora]
MPSTYTKFTCGHVLESRTAAGRAKEEPPQALKRTLTRILSLGRAGESTASRTRTLHQPQPERLKLGLRRVLTLGRFEPPTLTSIEECPNCQRNAIFESDVYLGWVDEQPELGEGSQPEEPSPQRPHTAQAVPQEFQTRRESAPLEGSPESRRQQARIPLEFIRDRTHAREQVQQEKDRDETLKSLEGRVQQEKDRDETLKHLEGRDRAPTLPTIPLGGFWDSEEEYMDETLASHEGRGRAPTLPLGGFWDPAKEESRIQHERNPFESDEDSI